MRAAMFDRQIRDAQAGFEEQAVGERAGGAEIQALPAGSAMITVRFRRSFEFEVGENFGEKKIRAAITVDQIGVAPEPSQPRLGRPFPFEHRAGIDIGSNYGVGMKFANPGGDQSGLGQDRIVIIGSERIRRDSPAELRAPVEPRRYRGGIGIGETDNRTQARVVGARIEPPFRPPRKPRHLGRPSLFEPVVKEFLTLVEPTERRATHQRKAEALRRRYDVLL